MNSTKRTMGAIILAAGEGKRMKSGGVNKNSILLNGKPLISYPVELLKKLPIDPIVVVVGHASRSVRDALKNASVVFATQSERLGTGHAVKAAMEVIPESVTDIIILYGDDSYVYTESIIKKLWDIHDMNDSALTFLTITIDNPAGLGRIIRGENGDVIDIVEEKDAEEGQKNIKEINPNCYIFKTEFLREYLAKIPKSTVTGEFYLPALIKLARDYGEHVEAVDGGFMKWRGINTPEDLEEAKSLTTF